MSVLVSITAQLEISCITGAPHDNVHLVFAPCILLLILGADTRVRISYKDEELDLKLPFGSNSRLFLSEVNKAWSGRLAPI